MCKKDGLNPPYEIQFMKWEGRQLPTVECKQVLPNQFRTKIEPVVCHQMYFAMRFHHIIKDAF